MAHLESDQTSERGGTFTVTLRKSPGDTVYSKTFPYVGESIPPAVRDSAIAAELNVKDEVDRASSELWVKFREIALKKTPHMYAGAYTILMGRDGTVWVGQRPGATGTTYLALDQTGQLVTSVQLPPRSRLHYATRETLWVVESDEDGLNDIVRYQVKASP